MKQQTRAEAISDAEIDLIIKSAWDDNASIGTNLKSIAIASASYGQRRLVAEGWKRFYNS